VNLDKNLRPTATVTFTNVDVQDVALDPHGQELTQEQADAFLRRNAKYIEEAMVNAGFEAIDTLLFEDGFIK
jgi:uncharacterized protein involved in high-affinity Fe2+ transport